MFRYGFNFFVAGMAVVGYLFSWSFDNRPLTGKDITIMVVAAVVSFFFAMFCDWLVDNKSPQ